VVSEYGVDRWGRWINIWVLVYKAVKTIHTYYIATIFHEYISLNTILHE
jgi:hypothetical protein